MTLQVKLDCLGCLACWGFVIYWTPKPNMIRGPVVMADDYQLKYVGMVALAIGAAVLFLGLVGLIVNLS